MSVYDDWKNAGSVDYNKMVAEGVPGYQSSNPSIEFGSGTGPGTAYYKANMGDHPSGGGGGVTAQPFDSNSMMASHTQDSSTDPVKSAAAAASAKFNQLFGNPGATVMAVLDKLGLGSGNTSPLANQMRGQETLLKPAYMLWQGGKDPSASDTTGDQWTQFATDFLSSMGKNLGDKGAMIKQALGLAPGQSNEWSTMLNSVDLTDEQRQTLINSLYGVMNMGSTSPFTQYNAGNIGRMEQEFAAKGASSDQFIDYIKSHLGQYMK